jgi:DNA segregation ATPase FtsK/SpoIIIE, S-DNA-T family
LLSLERNTRAVRVLACAAAQDPPAEMWVHELRGSGDLDPLERVSHRFVSGVDNESIGYAAESLRLLRTSAPPSRGAFA